ncbi:MAG: hypothetical protein H3C34_08600 [Caldilineaceae bacterium]|nr:hypothetical protein [Caldilineaceae bacterium]
MDAVGRLHRRLSVWRAAVLALTATGLLTFACRAPAEPLGSCSLAFDGQEDDAAVRAVLEAEGRFVVNQEIDALMALWKAGAYVADAKHTPADQSDDQYWRDKDAIRHRYVRTVFPGAPAAVTPRDLALQFDGKRVQVLSTTHIGAEIAPAGDRWVLVKDGSCWLIESLTYNLEPLQP